MTDKVKARLDRGSQDGVVLVTQFEKSEINTGGSLFVTGPQVYSAEECAELRGLVDAQSETGKLEHDDGDLYATRRSRVLHIPAPRFPELADKIRAITASANKCFNFALTDIRENIQLAIYDSSDAGFFDWHLDIGGMDKGVRKLSVSVPLNDAADFEGGDLEFLSSGSTPQKVEQKIGHPVVFPSWLVHRVSPVTRGKRYSMVCWISGPSWK